MRWIIEVLMFISSMGSFATSYMEYTKEGEATAACIAFMVAGVIALILSLLRVLATGLKRADLSDITDLFD